MYKRLQITHKLHYTRRSVLPRYHTLYYYRLLCDYPAVLYLSYYPHHNSLAHQLKVHMLTIHGRAYILNHNHRYFYPTGVEWEFLNHGTVLALMFTQWNHLVDFINSTVGVKSVTSLRVITLSYQGQFINLYNNKVNLGEVVILHTKTTNKLLQVMYHLHSLCFFYQILYLVLYDTVLRLVGTINHLILTLGVFNGLSQEYRLSLLKQP